MNKIVLFLGLAIFLFACDDLEVEPNDRYSDGVVWNDKESLDFYVRGFYTALRDDAEINSLRLSDGLTDILKYSVNNLNSTTIQNKVLLQENFITPNNVVLNEWSNYGRIKLQNEFLRDVEVYSAAFEPEFISVRKAEVRFMRAFLYAKMIRNHGGVILRLHNSGTDGGLDNEKDADKARASEEESWNFVLSELKEVALALKGHEWDAANYGRITAGTAYAFLTRYALYAQKYDDVIAAGNEVETMGYILEPEYKNIFNNNTSKEIILPVMFKKPDYVHYFDRHFIPTGDVPNRGGWGCPTEDLVENYQIKTNGEYMQFDWNNPAHRANPYQNREPRFYVSILYNGAPWNGRTIATYEGGKDGFIDYNYNTDNAGCVTGYFMRKFLQEGNPDVDKGSDSYWIEMRFAEVLLNMAEAYANTNQIDKAYQYLNRVRTRGGYLPERTPAASLTVFMSDLEKERMLELAFEGHRYWDLRRWKRAEEVIDGKRARGVRISIHPETGIKYRVEEIEKTDRYFPEKYYKIPVPESEIRNNALCEQTFPW